MKLGELHRIIAHDLASEELRFLRKLPGISAKKFAELLRITPGHLSGPQKTSSTICYRVSRDLHLASFCSECKTCIL